jgi:hypothetical protein
VSPPKVIRAVRDDLERPEFISILELKQLAAQRPADDPYREVILAEPDFIPKADFPGKAETWVILMRLAARKRRGGRS